MFLEDALCSAFPRVIAGKNHSIQLFSVALRAYYSDIYFDKYAKWVAYLQIYGIFMDERKCISLHTKNFVALAQPIKPPAKGWKTKVRKISKQPF